MSIKSKWMNAKLLKVLRCKLEHVASMHAGTETAEAAVDCIQKIDAKGEEYFINLFKSDSLFAERVWDGVIV